MLLTARAPPSQVPVTCPPVPSNIVLELIALNWASPSSDLRGHDAFPETDRGPCFLPGSHRGSSRTSQVPGARAGRRTGWVRFVKQTRVRRPLFLIRMRHPLDLYQQG